MSFQTEKTICDDAANGDLPGVKEWGPAYINFFDGDKTPLYAACMNNHLEVVKYLLNKRADTEERKHYTPLMIAAEKNYREVASELLKRRANIDTRDASGQTALHKASTEGHLGIVHLLFKYKANPEITDKDGHTALSIAARKNNADTVRLLLEYKAPINENALIAAAEGKAMEVIAVLVSAGANKEVRDDDGNTPLAIACFKKYVEVVTFLCEKGADINAVTNYENTPLHWAAKVKSAEITKVLLPYSPKITRNEFGQTAADVAKEMEANDIYSALDDYHTKQQNN